MNIGLLVAGTPPETLQRRFGSYGDMLEHLLGPGYAYRQYHVPAGQIPETPDDCDAYVVSGSPASVYDADPWIADLAEFVRAASTAVPVIGVCFGHQLLAEAFGGRVARAAQGRGAGLHRYELTGRVPGLEDIESLALPAWHQDQVIELPAQARVLAGSAFTPYAILGYEGARAISVQAHPEFSADFARSLVEYHRGARIEPAAADAALESLGTVHDGGRIAAWFRRFLEAGPEQPR